MALIYTSASCRIPWFRHTMSGQVMGDPHPSRIASCMYCFRHWKLREKKKQTITCRIIVAQRLQNHRCLSSSLLGSPGALVLRKHTWLQVWMLRPITLERIQRQAIWYDFILRKLSLFKAANSCRFTFYPPQIGESLPSFLFFFFLTYLTSQFNFYLVVLCLKVCPEIAQNCDSCAELAKQKQNEIKSMTYPEHP